MSQSSALKTYKNILRILSKTCVIKNEHYMNNEIYRHVVSEFKRHKYTTNIDNKHLLAAEQDAINMIQLLSSNRKHRELLDEYHTKGERSVQEAAELVGLKIPDQD